jgi:hypothetical protein
MNTRAIIFPNALPDIRIPTPAYASVLVTCIGTGATNNFDLNLTKSIPFGETHRLELRWEALNAFNHPQYVNVPQATVNGTPAGRFLNRHFTDSGIRSMWVQMKLVFYWFANTACCSVSVPGSLSGQGMSQPALPNSRRPRLRPPHRHNIPIPCV